MSRPRRATIMTLLACLCGLGAGAAPASAAGRPPVRHVFVIVLENKGFDATFGFYSPAPYLSLKLPSLGAFVPNYYGVAHQSLPNYIAMISGQGANPVTQADCPTYVPVLPGVIGPDGQALGAGCVYPSSVPTLAGQLAARGLSWKGYMEDMGNAPGQPATCRHPALYSADSTETARRGDQYAARHNPFVYFSSIIGSPSCAQNDVPLDRLAGDLARVSSTPNLSFITPNLCHDGHDATCVDGAAGGYTAINGFLSTWIPRIMASPAYRADGMIAVVFDESDGSDASACCDEPQFLNTPNNGATIPGRGGGRTGAVLLSPFIDPGTLDLVAYNHFGLLRSIEDIFGLGHIGYAALPGSSLAGDAFTCFSPTPRARRGRLPSGSEIKLAVFGRGTGRRELLETKLWHGGTISLRVARRAHPRRLRRLGRPMHLGACQLAKISLPFPHGRVELSARAFGGTERRTLSY